MYDLFYREEENKIKTYNNLYKVYKKPSVDLLDKQEKNMQAIAIDYSEKIEQFYKIFNINLKVNNFIDSLSVSRFYATLTSINSKSKISTIEKLTSDLAIYLNVKNVKLTVESISGEFIFEIPKMQRQTLYLKDIIEEQQIEKKRINNSSGKRFKQ